MSTLEAPQTVLITAAGGHIGSQLVPLLLKDKSKPKLVLPTRNTSRLAKQYEGNSSQLAIEDGNIQDPGWVESILKKHNVTSVFLCLTGDNELFTTMNFFNAMKRAGSVKHLVYLSACGDFGLEAIKAGALKDIHAAHATIKFLIEAQLKYGMLSPTEQGGFTYTVIGPTLFFDNDLRSKANMMEKRFFDEPLSPKGQARVATSDIALAVYNSLIYDRGQKHHGEKIMIGSKHAYTNAEIKDLWSQGLQRDIRFLDSSNEKDLDEFEAHFKTKAGPAWARDLRLMYEAFSHKAFGMSEKDYERQVEFLGKEPEDYGKFVKETAAQWLAEEN